MDHGPKIAQVAQLVGDPARANMLARLMDGRALTAMELAEVAGVSPQTTSGHLAKLQGTGLLSVARQGRHRYFRLASADIARLLEAIMVVAPATAAPKAGVPAGGRRDADKLREARTCYDHLAGRVAVAVADSLAARSCLDLTPDGGDVTPRGLAFFEEAGITLPTASRRRAYCRPCLDWSERRPHIAGAVGAAILSHALDRGWLRRLKETRALDLTPVGRRAFADTFGVRLDG
ncbi:putative HTH-type transcriptional regulator YdfF [Beijerinckiaceae bacterium RH AL1]|nr:helix-turn-helix transcriptional regulator [Beijerinckiaceae bacterium]VVB48677.1 putative HTH-type transcriptional regulator YdfF [Beijerinckiaceae bacterium RH CH11]VVB48759.1 putative HTH-type transcriptional regulator YdfF [Beijerinckiaceae bacterium RH AL8]VVC56513.1 putative HTH-type transcriptional regulator YdfF [Beijerinckiaceae bacterium RH AL1]